MATNYINQNAPKAFFPSYSPSTTSSSNPLLNPPVSQNQSNFFESTQQAFNAGRGDGGGGFGSSGSPQDISNKMDVLQLLATQKKMGLEVDYGLLPKEQRDAALTKQKADADYWTKLRADTAKRYFGKEQQNVAVANQKANEDYWTKQNQKYQFQ
jgi:hypothetical protein